MSHFRRKHKKHKNELDLSIQAQTFTESVTLEPSLETAHPMPTKSANLSNDTSSPLVKRQKVESLLENLSRVQEELALLKSKMHEKPKQPRIVHLNMMKLQDKKFHIDKNIYNISVGQIFSKEAYLENLNNKIKQFKGRIRQLEQEEEMYISRTIQPDQIGNRSRTIEGRKSLCGKFYSRLNTPSSDRRYQKIGNRQGQRSSYYKWRPDVDEQPQTFNSKDRYSIDMTALDRPIDPKDSRYRVRQQSSRPPVPSKTARSSFSAQTANQVKSSGSKFNTHIQALQTPNIRREEDSDGFNPEINQQEASQEQKYTGIIFKEIPEYSIIDINDDFRKKVTLQLQIPKGFPLEAPQIGSTTQEIEELGKKIYPVFGINLKKQKNTLISRKFKNGLYYQLGENKNILWYYSGSFYLGGWDTDLPTEGQKQGLGFEYIPDKYIYLGQFKDGMKHGKGSIKLFSNDPQNPDDFVAYEGQWQKGKPHGFGKHIDENNTKYIGDFVAGQKSGNAKVLTQDGLYYQGVVVKGIKHGYGLQKLLNGDVYMGEYENGSFNGKGIYKWSNGSSYQGYFQKGKRHGKGIWKGSNGDVFEGEYSDDLKNGWGKFTWSNGQIYEGEFKDDIRHGEGTYRHPSGKVGKFMWKQGKIDYRLYSKEEEKYRSRNVNEDENVHMTFSPSEQIM